MKKTLIILGLIACTSGIVYAEDAITSPAVNAQTEVQNFVNKETFKNEQASENTNLQKREKYQNRIKYDNSTNNKNTIKPNKKDNNPQFKGNLPNKKDVKGYNPNIRNKNIAPKYNAHRPDYRMQRPYPNGQIRKQQYSHKGYRNAHRPQNIRNHYAHNPKINNHKVTNKNIKRINNRKAYNVNKNIKRR